jgi:trans-2,3-dihydro-3-hydroxyanthranilate isomerase
VTVSTGARHRFLTADVFTSRPFAGNQLAVFPDARAIPDEHLGPIAREFNLSETVFVYPPAEPKHARKLRIFTPAEELPFAGHPTVGTAWVLAALGEIPLMGAETRIVLEEGVGPVPVVIRGAAKQPTFAQLTAAKLPEIGPPPPGRTFLAELLGLDPADILGGMTAPQAVSCGLPFLFVPVRDRDAVRRARIRMEHWESTLKSYWAPQVMVFSRDPEQPGADVRARVFVPGLAVPEDPATGSAAVALGGYLAARESLADGELKWLVEQGVEMGRPSYLHVEVQKAGGEITAVRVGGECVVVSEGTISA